MTVLDTHAWVWWTDGDPRLSEAAAAEIDSSEELLVSAISAWEVATLERLGRLKLVPDTRAWIRRALSQPRLAPVPVSPDVAMTAGSLLAPFPGDPADRIIYATTVTAGTRLVTADRRLAQHDPQRVVW